ncbi:MAG: hypothetical protein HUU50_09970 [Candidatus Brocadiae bacterium]|nr:hypothetical protein [Candidatus Brocadiia bacterium]
MKKFIAPILSVRNETHDVKTFRVANVSSISFIPGQYCIVSLPDNPQFSKTTKPFTFSHSPTQKEYLELTIKKMGYFTSAMFELKEGDRLEIKGPVGEDLTFEESIQEDIVFLSGGSGITPFMSMIRYWAAKGLSNNLTLLYGNRTEKDIIYEKELDTIRERHPKLKIVHILDTPSSSWQGEKGRLSKEIILKYTSEPTKKLWYLCGPPPMVAAAKKILSELAVSEENWKVEPWEIPGKS